MAFGNITTLYIPTAANAGTSQWGTDVRKLLDSADAASDGTTIANHGTSTAAGRRTFDPYTTSANDVDQTLYGWAINPTDMNSVSGARRFYPAGNHTVTVRMSHSAATAATGTIEMFVYRVASAASSRARTLLGSNTASVALPVLAGEVTATCTVALGEIVFEPDETIQYSFEFIVGGVVVTGRTVTFFTGTQSGVATSIATPKLGVLADTTGSASGTGTASGAASKVLGTVASAAGVGAASGAMSARADTTGTAAGTGTGTGAGGSVAGTTGSASGSGVATGVLGGIASVTGTATGTGTAAGQLIATASTTGSASGVGTATGVFSARADTTGTATGTGTVAGLGSSVAGTVGSASGSGAATGVTGKVLATVGTAEVCKGDYAVRVPGRSISGVAINHETGLPLTGTAAVVSLVRELNGAGDPSGDVTVQTTTSSTVDGSFSFPRDFYDTTPYHFTVDFTLSSVPYHGISDRGLIPELD